VFCFCFFFSGVKSFSLFVKTISVCSAVDGLSYLCDCDICVLNKHIMIYVCASRTRKWGSKNGEVMCVILFVL